MELRTFFDNFEYMAEAPSGIQKLREMILQLAVQGKLVPQDLNDEPAKILIQSIKLKRDRFYRDKKTKMPKPLPPINKDELPYQLPLNWSWARLGEVSDIIMGQSPPGNTYNDYGEGMPLVNGPVEFSSGPFGNTIKSKYTSQPTKLCKKNDLLLCVRGSTTGRTNIAAFDACIGRGVAAVRSKIHQNYLNWLIVSFRKSIYSAGKGSTFPSISFNKISEFVCPIPPLAEQKRIVAKVEEFMAICDDLEVRKQKTHSTCIQLNDASIDRLLTAPTPEKFNRHWKRIYDNFDVLYSKMVNVNKLRQAILQLAVQGKLVSQDPKDEPSFRLLEEIKISKKILIKDNTIRPLKKLHRKAQESPPYDLPNSWSWVRFNEIVWCYRGHNPPKSDFIKSPQKGYVRFVQITDFKTDSNAVYVPDSPKLKRVFKGEIIMAAYRHIGKLSREMEGAFNVALCKIIEIPPMSRDFIEMLIGTDLVKGELLRASERGHIPSMHSDHLLSLFVPIPPLKEQERIVLKVKELMALCDDLESKLSQGHLNNDRLVETAVADFLAA